MPEQKQVDKKGCDKGCDGCESCPGDLKNEALSKATDDLIDEIDAVLEDAELAVNYRQRGGQ